MRDMTAPKSSDPPADRQGTPGPVRVEIWSDVQCVWCYIGEARWVKGLARHDGDVEVVHRSFELMPDAPIDFDAQNYLQSQRGMTAADQKRAFDAITRVASAEGLAYDPARVKPTNSYLALQLLHHAESAGRRDAMSERLYAAYFAEGRYIGRIAELVKLATEAGFNSDEVRTILDNGVYAGAVDADVKRALSLGVRSVPFHVINGQYGLSGAQSVDAYVNALHQAATQS